MSEDFTGSDPPIRINFQRSPHQLDTLLSLYSLSRVIFFQMLLVKDTLVNFTISQLILKIMKRQLTIVTMNFTLTAFISPRDLNLCFFLALVLQTLEYSEGV